MEYLSQIKEATQYILSQTDFKPDYGVILGTGLGALVNDVQIVHEINYEDILHFPLSTVESHSGKLIFGHLGEKRVVVMKGRFHYYEGYNMKEVTFPVRVMKMLGIKKLIISNASGALNPAYQKSELMVINDHINMQTENPLTGKNLDEMGVRFPDMSEPYEQSMIDTAMQIAEKENIPLHQGVYVGVNGPNLETRAEYHMLRVIGADAVGMSTVPENIVARQMDIPVFAVSVLTDLCYPGHIQKISVEEVIAAAMKAEPYLTKLIKQVIAADKI
ncbi:purine-nucleoside phosphorylase [Reichenbachiella carrageenanivorans]|uniref:Purine nucleoside phosphorylase n=1 Tax=Reichenbachiella carrageenanivorans TaxID=2979869 RepID=A0ABY6CY57_9BACT|nr:purine-nucleoside phosphorylase [Reichenbachiella carrageenanivorans]UXX78304.1 purine-nucleoside phosphorylase [Reichenbachiella carrageenanivorans]